MVHPRATASLNLQRNFAPWNFHEEPRRKPRGNISGWNFRSLIHAWIWQLKPTVTRCRLHNTPTTLLRRLRRRKFRRWERQREALEESANKITRVFEPVTESPFSAFSQPMRPQIPEIKVARRPRRLRHVHENREQLKADARRYRSYTFPVLVLSRVCFLKLILETTTIERRWKFAIYRHASDTLGFSCVRNNDASGWDAVYRLFCLRLDLRFASCKAFTRKLSDRRFIGFLIGVQTSLGKFWFISFSINPLNETFRSPISFDRFAISPRDSERFRSLLNKFV